MRVVSFDVFDTLLTRTFASAKLPTAAVKAPRKNKQTNNPAGAGTLSVRQRKV